MDKSDILSAKPEVGMQPGAPWRSAPGARTEDRPTGAEWVSGQVELAEEVVQVEKVRGRLIARQLAKPLVHRRHTFP